ncbi:MAG: hypothetical protein CMM50_00870 [Rhodospirillaceae bacterium]|nr:hypothetical protein [Rhodospirillaceae bacterium]
MVVDASAVMAILQQEPEAARFAERIEAADIRLISAVSVLEIGIVAEARRGTVGATEVDTFLLTAELEIVPFDGEQAAIARNAFARFGKGRHAAGLNFGDCAAYALAASQGLPLLYKGDDFAATDIPAA